MSLLYISIQKQCYSFKSHIALGTLVELVALDLSILPLSM